MPGNDVIHPIWDRWGRLINFDFCSEIEPTETRPYMTWIDPDAQSLKVRDEDDANWLTIGGAGGGGAPADAQYLVLSLDSDLTDERRLIAGDGLQATDGGANGDYTLNIDVSDFAGAGLEDDGSENLRISAAAAGNGLTGGGGDPLAVDIANIAGLGLEDDQQGKLRISDTAAGSGLTGGSGFPLSVAPVQLCAFGLGGEDATGRIWVDAEIAGDGLQGGSGIALAVDATVVRTSGIQTIAGVKTFDDNLVMSATKTITLVNAINEFSTDGTLADDSDSAVPTEKATKAYVDGAVTAKGVAVFNNAALTIGTAAWVVLTFNSERWDDASFHSTVADTGRLTVPAGYDGWYVISGHVCWDISAAGTRRVLSIRFNGASHIATQEVGPHNTDNRQSISAVYYLSATNYVELLVYQNTGGDLDVKTLSNYSPEFRMVRIG